MRRVLLALFVVVGTTSLCLQAYKLLLLALYLLGGSNGTNT